MKTIRLAAAFFLKQARDSMYGVWIIVLPQVLYAGIRIFFAATGREGVLLSALTLLGALTAGLMNQPLLYGQLRDDGMLDRFSVAPVSALSLSAACLFSTFLLGLAGQILLMTVAFLFGDIAPGAFVPFLCASTVVLASALAAGLPLPFLFGNFMTLKSLSNVFLLVLFSLSGVFFQLSGPVGILHWVNPFYWAYSGLRHSAGGMEPAWTLFAGSVILALLGIATTALRSRRLP
jgi:ABC-type polysaccharide/polyol phosphate export permease